MVLWGLLFVCFGFFGVFLGCFLNNFGVFVMCVFCFVGVLGSF